MTYKEMKLTIGALDMDVVVRELYSKQMVIDNKESNEIVAVTFDSTHSPNYNREGSKLMLHEGKGASDPANAHFIPFLEEYRQHTVSKENSTRTTFVRTVKDFVELKDEENDSEEVLKIKENERNKQSRISRSHNLVFIKSLRSVSFGIKEKIYRTVYNLMTTPLVPNVTDAKTLAGQLFVEMQVAKDILRHIESTTRAIPMHLDLEKVERARYLLAIYREWVEAVFDIMRTEGLIRPLEVVVTSGNKTPYEIVVDEEIIEPHIEELCQSGELSFTKATGYGQIDSFATYMPQTAHFMTKRIESIAKPIHRYNEIDEKVKHAFKSLLRQPYEAQANGIAAALKSLDKQDKVIYVAGTGTGKTLMTISTAYIDAELRGETMKLLILCPDHLADTVWHDEIVKTVNGVEIHSICSVNDLIEYERLGYFDDKQKRAFILGQKFSKTVENYKPAVNWRKRETRWDSEFTFSCPCCGETVMKRTREFDPDTEHYYTTMAPAPFSYFNKMSYANYQCKTCNTPLWEPLTKAYLKKPVSERRFVYSGSLKGFYPTDKGVIREAIEDVKRRLHNMTKDSMPYKSATKEMMYLRELENIMNGTGKEGIKRATTKVSVAQYIFKKMQNRFTHLILDELHEYSGESLRAEASRKLAYSIKKVIGGTGSLMNGYPESFFNLAFLFNPKKMIKAGYTAHDIDKFQNDFGVVEHSYVLSEKGGKKKMEKLRPKKRPGISPLLFPYFMQDMCIFLSIEDMKQDMPSLDYIDVPVKMDSALEEAHQKLIHDIRTLTSYDKRAFKNTVQLNYSFLDAPTKEKFLYDEEGEVLIEAPVIKETENKKLEKLIEIADEEIRTDGRRMMIYTNYASDNINAYLKEKLEAQGFKVTVLNPSNEYSVRMDGSTMKCKDIDREKFIRNEVLMGTEILIVNPELVKTGYNLLDFPTILYYQLGYNVQTNRQADGRAWRLGQTLPCKIYYLYYEESIQQQVAQLMATKIVAASAIEGNMDETALHSMANDRTVEEELATVYYKGYKKAS